MRISDWSSDVCSSDLTALVIDAKTLRFFESAGDLARVRDRSANRIVADFKFSGEGETWDRLMLLGLSGGGKTLVRRDYGEGAAAEQIGRAHVCTPVPNAHIVCRLLLEKKNNN